jgi:hypothetical protein
MRKLPAFLAGGAAAGRVDHRHPQAVHREQEEALAHVGVREDHRFLAHVDPRQRVQRVGIRRRDAAVVARRIARDVGKLAHRCTRDLDLLDVAHLHPCHFGRDQRVAVDVGVFGDLQGFGHLGGGRCGFGGRLGLGGVFGGCRRGLRACSSCFCSQPAHRRSQPGTVALPATCTLRASWEMPSTPPTACVRVRWRAPAGSCSRRRAGGRSRTSAPACAR